MLGRGTTNIDIGDKGRRLSEVAKTVAATFISHSPESDIDGPPVKAVTKSVSILAQVRLVSCRHLAPDPEITQILLVFLGF